MLFSCKWPDIFKMKTLLSIKILKGQIKPKMSKILESQSVFNLLWVNFFFFVAKIIFGYWPEFPYILFLGGAKFLLIYFLFGQSLNFSKGQSWDFTSRSTARVILGQVLRIVTCGTRTHRGDSL